MAKPDILIGSSYLCDTGNKWFEVTARYFDAAFFTYDMLVPPADRDINEVRDHYIRYNAQQYRELVAFLERQTGIKMDLDKLSRAVAIGEKTRRLWSDCNDLRNAIPCPMAVRDWWSCIFPGLIDPAREESAELYQKLSLELKCRADNKIGVVPEEKYRIMWCGLAPWHALETLDYLESFGAVCVAVDWEYHPHPPVPTPPEVTDPYERLAWWFFHWRTWASGKAMEECGHQLNQAYLEWARDWKIDGAVIHLTVSCRPTSVGGVALRDMLWRFRKIPSFFIEGDLVDPRSYNLEQIKLQVGAFIETMERNKGEKARAQGSSSLR